MNTWRLIEGNGSAAMNMALDRAILQLAANGESPPTLRLYTWTPSAVSLGYFQRKSGPRPEVCKRLGLDIVRRPSGGRAVLHKGDLTYAVIAGSSDGMPYQTDRAYHLIGKGLLLGLRTLGIRVDSFNGTRDALIPDVCFLRPVAGEIVYHGKKFVGNAQAWSGRTLLQHGSIAIEPQTDYLADLFRPEDCPGDQFRQALSSKVTAINEILGRPVSPALVGEAVRLGMSEALGVKFEKGELTPEEMAVARELISQSPDQVGARTRRTFFPSDRPHGW